MSRIFTLLLVIAVAMGSSAFVAYGSLHPCDWILPAFARKVGVPEAMISTYVGAAVGDIQAVIRGQSPADCFSTWLEIQTDDVSDLLEKPSPG